PRVRGWYDEDEPVRREDDRLLEQAFPVQLLRLLRARCCEDVGWSALFDLEGQLVRAREDVPLRVVEGGQDVGERGGGEHGEPSRSRCLCRNDEAEGSREEEGRLFHRSIKTEVALTRAVAGMPTSRPRDCTASRVITETTRNGPASSSTWARSPST